MKTVILWNSASGYDKRPLWWKNFTEWVNSAAVSNTWHDINQPLAEHNAKFWFDRSSNNDSPRYLEFKTEGDYLMFVLKFS